MQTLILKTAKIACYGRTVVAYDCETENELFQMQIPQHGKDGVMPARFAAKLTKLGYDASRNVYADTIGQLKIWIGEPKPAAPKPLLETRDFVYVYEPGIGQTYQNGPYLITVPRASYTLGTKYLCAYRGQTFTDAEDFLGAVEACSQFEQRRREEGR